MAVRLFPASGGERVIDEADAVRVDEPFVLVTRWYPGIRQVQTVLTLLATDVTAAEVTANGIRTGYIVVKRGGFRVSAHQAVGGRIAGRRFVSST